jgi:dienelactone hydrolase
VRQLNPSRVTRRGAAAAAMILALLSAVSCSAAGPGGASPQIVVTPSTALFDTPMSTTISGLAAGAQTTVTATTVDYQQRAWSSTAQFTADTHGRISLSQPSTGGSYRGPDPMGLFETLTPAHPPTNNIAGISYFIPPPKAFAVTLQVSVNGRMLAATTTQRQRIPLELVVENNETLAATGIYGALFRPAHPRGNKPAVLVVGGSEGGLSTSLQAASLAAHGYPALALAYFNEPGLPPTLSNIPLEYFVTALKLLTAQPGVDPARILVWGDSRGSEAALLLGAHYPQLVHGVIATVPSSVINGGYPPTDPLSPAWTLAGAPLPFAPRADWGQPDPADAADAIIPVEQIHGPIFLLCAGHDRIWDSCPYTDAITHRLAQHHVTYPTTVLRYPTAGHLAGVLLPYLPFTSSQNTDGTLTTTGGTELADEQAEADAWPKLLTFLTHQ